MLHRGLPIGKCLLKTWQGLILLGLVIVKTHRIWDSLKVIVPEYSCRVTLRTANWEVSFENVARIDFTWFSYCQNTALDYTLVGKHMCSREGVLRSNPTTPKIFTKGFRRTLATFEECPIEGTSFIVHYTVFRGYLQCDRLL